MKITEMLLTPNRFSRPQTALKKVQKIALHYVGNAGSSALANRNYFENLKNQKHESEAVFASSHYIVGIEGEIIKCVPENEVAYCTNSANAFSISIENCHPKPDGKFTKSTNNSLIELCAELCKDYRLDPICDIIRHYDVTGKACPLYHVRNPKEWQTLKVNVLTELCKMLGVQMDLKYWDRVSYAGMEADEKYVGILQSRLKEKYF